MTSTTLELQHTKLTYYAAGQGFPLVLLHGFCADHTVWTGMLPGHKFIGPLLQKFRLLMPDLPGFGNSILLPPAESCCSMDQYADCIKAMLDAEKITQCALLGHSMGGYIAMNFAARFPASLSGLGLFHSTAYADDEEKKRNRTRSAIFVRQHGAGPFVKELYGKLFGADYHEKHQQDIVSITAQAISASGTEGIINACYAMRDREDTTSVLKKTGIPVLFIIGRQDQAVDPEKTLLLTNLPSHAETCILENAGHMGMFEAPGLCLEAISNWMSLIA